MGRISPEQRKELRDLFTTTGLTPLEAREVFSNFLVGTWGAVVQDGEITAEEIRRLITVVRELGLPVDCIPQEIAAVMRRAA